MPVGDDQHRFNSTRPDNCLGVPDWIRDRRGAQPAHHFPTGLTRLSSALTYIGMLNQPFILA
jgi:hypothetical protein